MNDDKDDTDDTYDTYDTDDDDYNDDNHWEGPWPDRVLLFWSQFTVHWA